MVAALLSLLGTCIGSLAGILTSNKLTTYRIGQLEDKVSKHNNLIDRMYKIETRVTVIEDKIESHESI
jgi:hypothetical protein